MDSIYIIRQIADVALPASLSSVNSVTQLVNMLLPSILDDSDILNYTETLSKWSSLNEEHTPDNKKSARELEPLTESSVHYRYPPITTKPDTTHQQSKKRLHG